MCILLPPILKSSNKYGLKRLSVLPGKLSDQTSGFKFHVVETHLQL
jgi:hypothetical protein